jgi:uncharacterized membrane protein
VQPLALAINKKNETPLFATVFVVLFILLHVSAYIGHLQVLRIQNVKKRTAVCNTNYKCRQKNVVVSIIKQIQLPTKVFRFSYL